jgi:hypothetical protein
MPLLINQFSDYKSINDCTGIIFLIDLMAIEDGDTVLVMLLEVVRMTITKMDERALIETSDLTNEREGYEIFVHELNKHRGNGATYTHTSVVFKLLSLVFSPYDDTITSITFKTKLVRILFSLYKNGDFDKIDTSIEKLIEILRLYHDSVYNELKQVVTNKCGIEFNKLTLVKKIMLLTELSNNTHLVGQIISIIDPYKYRIMYNALPDLRETMGNLFTSTSSVIGKLKPPTMFSNIANRYSSMIKGSGKKTIKRNRVRKHTHRIRN